MTVVIESQPLIFLDVSIIFMWTMFTFVCGMVFSHLLYLWIKGVK
jgi:hypothetical protein